MPADQRTVALVTGANRGIGFEVCRQLAARGWVVLVAARDPGKATAAAAELAAAGLAAEPLTLDVTSDDSVAAAAAEVARRFGRLDVLVNNAGGGFDADRTGTTAELDDVRATLDMNLFGPWRTVRAYLPLLKLSSAPRVVNVSSEAGSFGGGYFALPAGPGTPGYGVSKAALNALTVKLAAELKPAGILVNAVCPGFTATQPGTAEMGARPVADGAASVVWAAMLPAGGPTGGFFRDGQPLPW